MVLVKVKARKLESGWPHIRLCRGGTLMHQIDASDHGLHTTIILERRGSRLGSGYVFSCARWYNQMRRASACARSNRMLQKSPMNVNKSQFVIVGNRRLMYLLVL